MAARTAIGMVVDLVHMLGEDWGEGIIAFLHQGTGQVAGQDRVTDLAYFSYFGFDLYGHGLLEDDNGLTAAIHKKQVKQ